MELYQLQAFAHIAKTGNMTASANQMNISLSALSTQLKNLEQTLNTRLFIRGPKGMALTEPGRLLYDHAKKVLDAAEELKSAAGRLSFDVSGNLNIGINTDPTFLEVSHISRQMLDRYPNVGISFIESQSFETIKMLNSGDIDVGFHYGSLDDLAIFSVLLSVVTVNVVLPQRFCEKYLNEGFETISQLPWVWTRYDCPFHTALKKHLEKESLSLNQITDAVEENIVRELVRSGTGLGLMRKDEALTLENEGTAAIWKGLELEIPLGIACLERRRTEPVIDNFIKIIQGCYK